MKDDESLCQARWRSVGKKWKVKSEIMAIDIKKLTIASRVELRVELKEGPKDFSKEIGWVWWLNFCVYKQKTLFRYVYALCFLQPGLYLKDILEQYVFFGKFTLKYVWKTVVKKKKKCRQVIGITLQFINFLQSPNQFSVLLSHSVIFSHSLGNMTMST